MLILAGTAGVLGLVAVLLHLAWLPWAEAPPRIAAPPQATAQGTFRPTRVQWEALGTGTVTSMRFTPAVFADGQISIDNDLTEPVFSPYSGRVLEVDARLGQQVRKGAPLCAIDGTELVAGTDKLLTALATVRTDRARQQLARTVARRMHALYLAKGIALRQWQQSETALTVAQDRLRAARVAVAAATEQLSILGASPQEIARLEQASPARTDPVAWVRAPSSGTILARRVNPGETIISARAGASRPLFTIGDLSTVWLVAEVRESDAARIRLGEPVVVSVLTYPGRTFDARLSWIAPSIDPKTHRLPVRAEIANPEGALKPGMFAHFRIAVGPAVTAPAVPENAVIHSGTTERIWVIAPDKSVHVSVIRTGLVRRGMVEVLHGAQPGERIITSGSLFINHAAGGG